MKTWIGIISKLIVILHFPWEAVHLPLRRCTYMFVTDLYDVKVIVPTCKSIEYSSRSDDSIVITKLRDSTFCDKDRVIWSQKNCVLVFHCTLLIWRKLPSCSRESTNLPVFNEGMCKKAHRGTPHYILPALQPYFVGRFQQRGST